MDWLQVWSLLLQLGAWQLHMDLAGELQQALWMGDLISQPASAFSFFGSITAHFSTLAHFTLELLSDLLSLQLQLLLLLLVGLFQFQLKLERQPHDSVQSFH